MSAERCACPCNEPLGPSRGNRIYKDGRHRQRAYRERKLDREARAGGLWTAMRAIRRTRPETRPSAT